MKALLILALCWTLASLFAAAVFHLMTRHNDRL